MTKTLLISCVAALLFIPAATQAAEPEKAAHQPEAPKTYVKEMARPKAMPPVPLETAKDPASVEPAAGGDTKASRPYEYRWEEPQKIKIPQQD